MHIFRKRLNQRETVSLLELINYRPMPPDSYKVLFNGDSLTIHGGAMPGTWDIPCGMAASSPNKDYVHLVVAGIQAIMERPVEALYNNGGNGKIRSILEYVQVRRFEPDFAIIQGGENDRFDDNFRRYYPQLIDHFQCGKIVLGDWYSQEKSEYSRYLCKEREVPFIDLYAISSNKRNSGYAGPYGRKDVASHPNDLGMIEIANAILSKVDSFAFGAAQHA